MKLEYRNGVRITKLVTEMSPLEAAINRYEDMARKHFSDDNKHINLTKEEREIERKKSLAYLEHEKRHLSVISEVQALLEAYREGGLTVKNGTDDRQRERALNMLEDEKHHPTDLLEKFMRAESVPKPSSQHTAHHILPGSGRWRKVLVARARSHIHEHGIRINDPANGVYLLTKDKYTPNWTMPKSRGHLRYHTAEYEVWVSQKIRQLHDIDFIKTQLQVIGRLLQHNEPKAAFAKMKHL